MDSRKKLAHDAQTIFKNKILSCPVVTATGELVGSISIIDIVLFIINVCQSSQELVQALNLPVSNEKLFVNFDDVPNMLRSDTTLQKSGFLVDKAAFLTSTLTAVELTDLLKTFLVETT